TTELTVWSAAGESVVTDESWWCPGEGPVLQAGEVDGKRFVLRSLDASTVWSDWALPSNPPLAELTGARLNCPDGVAAVGDPLGDVLLLDLQPGLEEFRLRTVTDCVPVDVGEPTRPGGRLLHSAAFG